MVEQNAAPLDRVFQALSDPTRRAMLRSLSTGELNIGALAEPFAMSFAAASKHVKVLERAGLVERRVAGRSHLCRLNPAPLRSVEEWLAFYRRFWADRLNALESLLEAGDGGRDKENAHKGG